MTAMPPRPWILRALLATLITALLLAAAEWAYVPTFRLFLDTRIAAPGSAAAQQLDVEHARVVPRIVTRGPDRVAFATDVRQDSTIHVGLRSRAPTAYAIEWRHGAFRRVLAQGTVTGASSISGAYPTGTGVIELVSDGPITWVDPRVVRNLPRWPFVWAAAFLGLAWLAWRPGVFRVAAVSASLAAALLVSEAALRALGDHTTDGIASERHDLGEVTRDQRWIDSPRYGRRLRAGATAVSGWQEGDIVRMGYIPPASNPGPMREYPIRIDAEGFRNEAVRDRFEVAALGDSFTDAMTMPAGASWPAQLEQALGVPVQNYGTAGFGPQQELLVLQDFVAAHRPRTVVLAFFAGNDIFDAEAFDQFQRAGGVPQRAAPGWRTKDVVSRADTWFVVSALRAGSRWLGSNGGGVAEAAVQPTQVVSSELPVEEASPGASPAFDRGTFAVPVAGRVLRWAFMPPYLNTLYLSERELAARPGWRLTRDALAEMERVSRSFGATFVVMFLPFKSQVYLPLLKDAFPADELRSALGYSLERYDRAIDLDRLYANRLAQNRLMARYCAEADIPFLDTTPALAARVATGANVYFPDESHLNESGEALVAQELASFLHPVLAARNAVHAR